MSRVSEFIKRLLHATDGESTTAVVTRFLGDHQADIAEYAQEVVALLHFSDLPDQAKKEVARSLVIAAGKSFGVVIPGWIADFIVQEALMLVRSHGNLPGAGSLSGSPTQPPTQP
jgi:hypothetical protein